MAVPRSYTKTFNIEDIEFYHHYAQDAHGTVCNTYMLDGLCVSSGEFYRILREVTEEALGYISQANGLHQITRGMT